jgi:hypothetical protein
VSSLKRRSAWFYMTDAKREGGLDRNRIADTDLCVATGASLGVMRLQLSRCESQNDGRVLFDESFASSEDANVIPIADTHRRFVAILMNGRTPPAAADPQRAVFDGSSWFDQAPAPHDR